MKKIIRLVIGNAKFILFIFLAAEIAGIFFLLKKFNNFVSDQNNFSTPTFISRPSKQAEKEAELKIGAVTVSEKIASKPAEPVFLPDKFLIGEVPFSVQSPDSKWDERGEEACEEMSEIIVDHFWTKKPLDRALALAERNKLIDYEIQHYGGFHDEDAVQIAQRLKEYFNYKTVEVVYDFTLQELKRKIIEGRPIIVPAAGRLLNNPFFKQPGPLYHNLVIIGYEGSDIITNDPGIGRGKGYRYNENVLYNAIHDFPGTKENILAGRKAMIIVYPNN